MQSIQMGVKNGVSLMYIVFPMITIHLLEKTVPYTSYLIHHAISLQ
jgi:hypothetical protein